MTQNECVCRLNVKQKHHVLCLCTSRLSLWVVVVVVVCVCVTVTFLVQTSQSFLLLQYTNLCGYCLENFGLLAFFPKGIEQGWAAGCWLYTKILPPRCSKEFSWFWGLKVLFHSNNSNSESDIGESRVSLQETRQQVSFNIQQFVQPAVVMVL